MSTYSTSPLRLLDGGGSEYERQLLAASDGDVPSAASAARVAAALRAAAVQGAPVQAPSAGAPAPMARVLKPALGIVGSGVLAMLVASQWPARAPAPASRPQNVAAASAAVAPATPAPEAYAPQRALEASAAERGEPPPRRLETKARAAVARAAAPRAAPPAATDLAAEVRAIESIQTLLGWGQLDDAERALRQHRASFPHGELALEADLLDVDLALARAETDRARALARSLLERPGASRYRARLNSVLNATGARASDLGSNARPR